MTDTLSGIMGCTPILSIEVAIKKIKGVAHKNGHVDRLCKQGLESVLAIFTADRNYTHVFVLDL